MMSWDIEKLFDETFHEIDNDKLSENGVMAMKTMNTLLHVFEAYTELYRVDHKQEVKRASDVDDGFDCQ